MTKILEELLEEKAKYETHPENSRLQHEELDSIANAMLAELAGKSDLTAEETEIFEWAKVQIGA